MSLFEVRTYKVAIEPHPNADAIELARIGDYLSIVKKGLYQSGDLVAYIPEQSIVPANILEELGLVDKLAGSEKNRVKAMKLRGILSQGLIYPARSHWELGQDVKEDLGITKWEPPIPTHLAGEVQRSPYRFQFDIENIKKHPTIFVDGEEVIFTEKIHGSCMITCLVPEQDRHPEMIDGKLIVISKGLADQQLFFKDNERNKDNSYVRCAKQMDLASKLEAFNLLRKDEPVWVVGELFGMQDLKYGVQNGALQFRIFGIKIGDTWCDWSQIKYICEKHLQLPTVPILYEGPFSKEVLDEHTKGKESVSGAQAHLREGIVVYPAQERYHPDIGRVFLKSVSEAYLLRKDGTEFT